MPARKYDFSVEMIPLANVHTSAMVCDESLRAIFAQSEELASRLAASVAWFALVALVAVSADVA